MEVLEHSLMVSMDKLRVQNRWGGRWKFAVCINSKARSCIQVLMLG
jgi:hypothetical protein